MMSGLKNLRVALFIATLAFPIGAMAQSGRAQEHIASGIEAYRAENYAQALSDFEAAVAVDPDNAEAHFLLARVLFDTPLRDEGRAGDEIERARDLDPENLQYMVAELQQLRTDTWNFFQEIQRTNKRLSLARDILERDPDNGFAHEEFGAYFIRDYWYYRNAIAFPTLDVQSRGLSEPDDQDTNAILDGGVSPELEGAGSDVPGEVTADVSDFFADVPDLVEFVGSSALGVTDRFNIETIRSQGANVLALQGRADRAYERALFHLETASANDPRRRSVYDHLTRLYALAEDWDKAIDVATQMLVYFPDDEAMWRYIGLANHRLGRGDAAETSFREAMEIMDPESRSVFQDISLLLPPEELSAYEETPDQVASQFWTSKDPRYLTPYNERKIEHYARLTYADLMYKSDDLNLRGWETQRGKIHVRYGVPRSDVTITGGFQQIVEAFSTRAKGIERQGFDRAAFERPPEEMNANRFNIWDYGDFRFVFEDPIANGEFRLYSPPADLFAVVGGGAVERMDYEIIARNTFRDTPEQYDYSPPGRQIGLPYLVTSFKGVDGNTDLFVHYGIPVADNFDPLTNDVVNVTVQTGAFLISEDRDILAERRRTLYGLRSPQIELFAETQLWTDTQAMEARPGTHEISVEFETVGGGTSAVQRRSIEVPDFSGNDLALSSLMLAYHVEDTDATSVSGQIVRDGLAIKPAPWSVFHHEQPVYLFFEIYNLRQSGVRTDYQVEAQLRPKDTSTGIARIARGIFGGGERGVSTEYPVQGDSRDDSQYVILDAAEQEPGFYTLTLKITDRVSGRSVEETTDLYLE